MIALQKVNNWFLAIRKMAVDFGSKLVGIFLAICAGVGVILFCALVMSAIVVMFIAFAFNAFMTTLMRPWSLRDSRITTEPTIIVRKGKSKWVS